MFQGKNYLLSLDPAHDTEQRLDALAETLIKQGVPRGHELFAQAPGLDDLPIGAWPDVQCLPEDWLHATAVLIKW